MIEKKNKKRKRQILVGDFWLMTNRLTEINSIQNYWEIQFIAHLKNHKKRNRWVAVKKPAKNIRKFDIYNSVDFLVFDDYGITITYDEECNIEFYLCYCINRSKKKSALASDLK